MLIARQSLVEAGVGKCSYVSHLDEPTTFESHIIRLRLNKSLVDSEFVYYYFNSPRFRRMMLAISNGVAAFGVRGSDLAKLEIEVPPISDQKAIVTILGALDDKIELNLQMNKTLEEMAMTLYKHWFVDFGPFKDGKFVDSELGAIPEGWKVKSMLAEIDLLSGGTPKTKVESYWNGDVDWVSAKDIGEYGQAYITNTERNITELGVQKSAAKILPPDTVVVVARGSVGKYGITATPMAINQSCYGLYSKGNMSQAIVYLLVSNLISYFQSRAYGSVFDTITTSTFSATKIAVPPEHVLGGITPKIDELFELIKANSKEVNTLSSLRDLLLPKLISGEIRVKDAQNLVAEVL